MKRKRAIFTILCVMVFSLCGFAGAAFAETGTGSSAKTYVAGGGFHASEVESTTPGKAYVELSNVPNGFLVLNKKLGGGAGINSTITVDLDFVTAATSFIFGMVPTNAKADIAADKIVSGTNGVADSNYFVYWNNGETYKVDTFADNTWREWGGDAAIQEALSGRMSLRLEIKPYGNSEISVKRESDADWVTLFLRRWSLYQIFAAGIQRRRCGGLFFPQDAG